MEDEKRGQGATPRKKAARDNIQGAAGRFVRKISKRRPISIALGGRTINQAPERLWRAIIVCSQQYRCCVSLSTHVSLMSAYELEISEEHPLALELASLRASVARYQVRIVVLCVPYIP